MAEMIRQSPGFEESPVHSCTVPRIRKKKLVFTSPRFSNRDEDIFVRNENLFDSAKRWGCISEQAGDHQQSGRVLVLHRTMSPESLLYGMTREVSLRVRSLSLVLDKREYDLSKWVDIISVTLINLENLSIVDSQFKDLSITRLMQRSYILQKMPNLRSIDEIDITIEERKMLHNRSSTGSQVVDCDTDDETASLDSPRRLKSKCNNIADKKPQPTSPRTENAEEETDFLNTIPQASSALQCTRCKSNALHCTAEAVIECKKDNLDIESVASSHIEWTAACGVLTFRSDNVCVPGIRLPFCGSAARSICDEENQKLRAQAKKRLHRKNKSCTPVQRQVPNSLLEVGNQRFATGSLADGSRVEAKFFPSDDDLTETKATSVLMDQNGNTPVKMDGAKIVGRGEAAEIISQPLPLVRIQGYKDIQQPNIQHSVTLECVRETALPLRRKHHILSSSKENHSMFDSIYDEDENEDEDEIIMDVNSNQIKAYPNV